MNPHVRVARIITRLNIGGPSIQAANLSQHLTPKGFRTLLVHGRLGDREGDMSYLVPPSGVDVAYVDDLKRPLSFFDDVRAFWRIYRLLVRFRPEIVHTHMAKAGTLGRVAALVYNATAGRRRPARLVHTYHGHVFDGYFSASAVRLFLRIERWLARRTDAVVAISPEIARDLTETYRIAHKDRVRIIPLGFELSPFAQVDDRMRQESREALQIPAVVPVITTVGRLTGIKRHALFLEAAACVSRRRAGAVFLIAGDGELRDELEHRAQALNLTPNVRFLGWRRDLATIYAASDVFVVTSLNEGTPVALIEAMAAGVPGVSTDVGGIRHVISHPDAGIVVETTEPAAIAEAILQLLDAPDRRRAIGERARQVVLDRFGLDRLVEDVATLYRTAMDGDSRDRVRP